MHLKVFLGDVQRPIARFVGGVAQLGMSCGLLATCHRSAQGPPDPYVFGVSRLIWNTCMIFQVLRGILSCLGTPQRGPVYAMANKSNFAYAKRARARKRPKWTGSCLYSLRSLIRPPLHPCFSDRTNERPDNRIRVYSELYTADLSRYRTAPVIDRISRGF
jgi:hypothetical protein